MDFRLLDHLIGCNDTFFNIRAGTGSKKIAEDQDHSGRRDEFIPA
jgi:hypothetical protein